MLEPFNIKMLSTSTLLYTHTGQSESVLCRGEERRRNRKKEKDRESERNYASEKTWPDWPAYLKGGSVKMC